MLGAIIGDIIGSRFEFNPTNNYDFTLFTDACGFTDDTICTIAVADALLRGRSFGESLHAWCRRYPRPMGGYGGHFAQWVGSSHPQPYGSFGNGSAMRVSAVGWLGLSADEVMRRAAASAACTHNHPEGIRGAEAVALAIHDCRALFRSRLPEGSDSSTIMAGLNRALGRSGYDISGIRLDEVRNRFDETCRGTVPVAFWIIVQSRSFEDAVRRAVCLGADADTLGAIVGSIAEAIWGIPAWIKECALRYLPSEMREVLHAFRGRVGGRYPEVDEELRRLMQNHFLLDCRYYDGDDKASEEGDVMDACYRDYERVWINEKLPYKSLEDEVSDLAKYGVLDIMREDGSPMGILGILYNRLVHWTNGYIHDEPSRDSFVNWVRNDYEKRPTLRQRMKKI